MWYWLIGINILAFALYGIDKAKAKRHAWRISEKVLLGTGLLGGALGALLGMKLFHHKTRHWYFIAINTLALIVYIVLIVWLAL